LFFFHLDVRNPHSQSVAHIDDAGQGHEGFFAVGEPDPRNPVKSDSAYQYSSLSC
jgi:hypothetical protein